MDYIFNELSIQPVYSKGDFDEIMRTFVEANVEARVSGLKNLRLYENSAQSLYQLRFSADCSVFGWLDDETVDRDLRDNFRLITTSIPLMREQDIKEMETFLWAEYFVEMDNKQHRVYGLGAAHVYDILSASLPTLDFWKSSVIDISYRFLSHDAEEKTDNGSINHFSTKETFWAHLDQIRSIQRDSIDRSADLWENREIMFPNLLFLNDLKSYFFTLGDSRELTLIMNALHKLDDFTANWKDGSFNHKEAAEKTGLKISPESNATIQKFGSQRKFTIPNLGKKLFDLHVKLGDVRVHFYPDEDSRKVYVGYAGKHLRIVSTN